MKPLKKDSINLMASSEKVNVEASFYSHGPRTDQQAGVQTVRNL